MLETKKKYGIELTNEQEKQKARTHNVKTFQQRAQQRTKKIARNSKILFKMRLNRCAYACMST